MGGARISGFGAGLHHALESGNIPGGALVPLPVGLRWPFSDGSKQYNVTVVAL